jgi:hypothetical protein
MSLPNYASITSVVTSFGIRDENIACIEQDGEIFFRFFIDGQLNQDIPADLLLDTLHKLRETPYKLS